MSGYQKNYIFFYQDFLSSTDNQEIRHLCLELREIEKMRLEFFNKDIEIYKFEEDEDETVLLFLLLYTVSFHLFYLKMNSEKNQELIILESEILHKIKTFFYLNELRAPVYLFPKYCLERLSRPLNDGLLFIVKALMTTLYFCMGWIGRLGKCIR